MIDTNLGPYKILEQLGAGGMGEVWLGEDTRLGRKVAIKVLPAEFASDPERLARFEQEARAAAALNHPHIAAVFDVGAEIVEGGEAGGEAGDETTTHFIVQEYLQGQSLRERLDKGALPLPQALDLLAEVGEALAAAHKAGIVHRDLKPDNIFITEEGHAKVLDFGLAKLTEAAAPLGESASMSPTMLGTVAGQVMGTAGYMAPEQVNGEEVDARADVFAFGCVLYEAVTGTRAFAGENVHDTLSRIISQQPAPLRDARRDLPAKLDWIVDKALAKAPAQRYQHADDLIVDLQGLRFDVQSGAAEAVGSGTPGGGAAESGRSLSGAALAAFAGVVAIIATALGLWLGRVTSPQGSVAAGEFNGRVNVPAGMHLPGGLARIVRISKDGKTLVYLAADQSGRRLYRRNLDTFVSVPIVGTDEGFSPFLSPDAAWVGFTTDAAVESISIVPINGGAPRTVCTDCTSGAWGDDGYIYFIRRGTNFSIWRVPEFGREESVVTNPIPEQGLDTFQHVQPLPGGRGILFQASDPGLNSSVGVGVFSLDTREAVLLERGARDPVYSATGHILYVRGETLMALPFDAETLQQTGDPVAVVESVRVENGGAVQADVSDGGVLVYIAGGDAAGTRLVTVDREGNADPIFDEPRVYRAPRVSPNGERILVTIQDGDATDVFVVDADGGTPQPITNNGLSSQGIWMDDETIAFATTSEDSFVIKSVRVDLSGAEVTLVRSDKPVHPGGWSRDTSKLIYSQDEGNRDYRIYEIGEEDAPVMISPERGFSERDPTLSPDGKLLAYISRRNGVDDVHVRPYPGTSAGVSATTVGGWTTAWSRNENELLYLSHGFGWPLTSASLQTEPELDVLDHETLFTSIGYWSAPTAGFSSLPNGRLVMLEILVTDQVSVVSNWLAEMESRVGGR